MNTQHSRLSNLSIVVALAAVTLLIIVLGLNIGSRAYAMPTPPLAPQTGGPTVVATVTVGINPNGIGVNPATNRVYVANSNSDSVSVINGVNNTVVVTVTVGDGPAGVGVNPTTNRVYVANSNNDNVMVIQDDVIAGLQVRTFLPLVLR